MPDIFKSVNEFFGIMAGKGRSARIRQATDDVAGKGTKKKRTLGKPRGAQVTKKK